MLPRPVTWLLVALTAIALPAAIASTWVAAQVGDTEAYVDTVGPLAEEETLRDAAHTELERAILNGLGDRATGRPQLMDRVDQALTRVLDGPEFPGAWREGNRLLHREATRILEAEETPGADGAADPWVRADFTPLVDDIATALREEGVRVPARLTERELTVPVVRESEIAEARSVYRLLETLGLWLPVVWVVLLAVTLITARRKVATLGHLAVASLITVGLLAVGLALARDALISQVGDDTVAATIWSTLTRDLWSAVWSAMLVAALALVARVALGLVRRHVTD